MSVGCKMKLVPFTWVVIFGLLQSEVRSQATGCGFTHTMHTGYNWIGQCLQLPSTVDNVERVLSMQLQSAEVDRIHEGKVKVSVKVESATRCGDLDFMPSVQNDCSGTSSVNQKCEVDPSTANNNTGCVVDCKCEGECSLEVVLLASSKNKGWEICELGLYNGPLEPYDCHADFWCFYVETQGFSSVVTPTVPEVIVHRIGSCLTYTSTVSGIHMIHFVTLGDGSLQLDIDNSHVFETATGDESEVTAMGNVFSAYNDEEFVMLIVYGNGYPCDGLCRDVFDRLYGQYTKPAEFESVIVVGKKDCALMAWNINERAAPTGNSGAPLRRTVRIPKTTYCL